MAFIDIPIESFSASEYAAANPDIGQAMRSGKVSSAWHHYVSYGVREGRPGVAPELQAAMVAYYASLPALPIPAERLRKRVHGKGDATSFQLVGLLAALDMYRVIRETPIPFGAGRVLDFGCGCGRVARYLHAFGRPLDLVGSDIDPEAIDWSRDNLTGVADFVVNGHLPPLPFPDESFDLVYSVSVFTHLPEEMQFAWLAELTRVTRVGGYQVHSVNGEELAHKVNWSNRRRLREAGFVYVTGRKTDGLPRFYQTAFHTNDYIRSRWSDPLRVVTIESRGLAANQNLVVLQKP